MFLIPGERYQLSIGSTPVMYIGSGRVPVLLRNIKRILSSSEGPSREEVLQNIRARDEFDVRYK